MNEQTYFYSIWLLSVIIAGIGSILLVLILSQIHIIMPLLMALTLILSSIIVIFGLYTLIHEVHLTFSEQPVN